ncbi:M48 family metallopeptidase [Streptomyces rishiriensis]|uniref:M48 family metallopeptidase n=1 Tax=Streptomyces rishiriensis TaxID=68264 RepID=UPI00131F2FCE|nr:M48 family metallopeptidase [Streptomyces rishiriensis]
MLISTEGVNIATVKLAALALALATGTVAAMARTVVGRSGPQHGILVTSAEAPLLWNHVVLLAAEVGTRPPHEIRVTAEPNAYVVEHTRLLGLVRGRRCVCVGAPLLTALPVQSPTAVLGHELAHFSHLDTRLAVVTYGGRDLLARVVDAVPPGAPHRLVLQGYLHLYSLVSSSGLQRQEFLADRCAARVTDPGTAAAAIEKVHTAAADWQRFVGDHMNPARTGRAPAGILPAFGRFLAAGGSGPAAWQPAPRPATWDTHPPLADRIEALLSDALPADATEVDSGGRPIDRPGFRSPAAAGLSDPTEHSSVHADAPWPTPARNGSRSTIQARAIRHCLVGLGQVRSGVGMSRWQVGQAPAQVARRVCGSRTTW